MARRFRKLGKFCGIGLVGDWVVVGFSGGLGDWLGFYEFCGVEDEGILDRGRGRFRWIVRNEMI